MADDDELFLTIIDRLAQGGVLSDIVLIGSWVLPIYCKYVHPEMEIEFLIPEQGRGARGSISVDALRVQAQPLRFLSLAYDRSMVVQYQGYDIRVPEPEAFVLLKLLVIPRRKDRSKVQKDAYTARSVGEYLLDNAEHKEKLIGVFADLPKGWQQKIRSAAKEHFPRFLEITS